MELKICNKCSKETYDYVFVYNEFSDDTLYICKACDAANLKQIYINAKNANKNYKINQLQLQYEVAKLTSENEGLKEENNRLRILLENGTNN